jgi:hypothetical protein
MLYLNNVSQNHDILELLKLWYCHDNYKVYYCKTMVLRNIVAKQALWVWSGVLNALKIL